MNNSTVALFALLSLAASACQAQVGAASEPQDPGVTGEGAIVIAGPSADPNADVTEVDVLETRAASTFRADRTIGITLFAKNAKDELVISDDLTASAAVASPGVDVESIDIHCTRAAKPARLGAVAVPLRRCETTIRLQAIESLVPGAKLSGVLTIGSSGAKAPFELVVPES